MNWVEEELKAVDLGDKRRDKRLIKIIEDLANSPESSVPLASRDAAALQGMYDFWSNPRVSAEAILAAHQKSTIGRMGEDEVVLAIQDTTELDYSGHRGKQGLGYLHRSDTKGLLVSQSRIEG